MSAETLRTTLYQFIVKRFNQYDLERIDPNPELNGWHNNQGNIQIDELYQHNQEILAKVSLRQLKYLDATRKLIEGNDLRIMDKEMMLPWDASGFIFNYKGKLIIFN